MDNSNETAEHRDEILIVEDSATQTERLKYILGKNRYRVVSARNGREAIVQITTQIPVLVISDVVMPEMDGYQLCGYLKKDPRLRNIPVILLTSLNDPIDVVRGLESGADNFIFKPYDERYLLSRVAYILANRHLRETETARMGVEVFFAGRKFFITSDRLQILNLLLSTYETAVERNRELSTARDDLRHSNENLEVKVVERTAALQQEIAERKLAEAQVHEQAELLNKARDAIIAIDLEHRITYWNTSAERLYGWSFAEVLGQKIESLYPSSVAVVFGKAEPELFAKGEWRGDYPLVTKAGVTKHVESTWSLVSGGDERPQSILLIETDVTNRKKLESESLRAQRMESIGMLAGGVAHDLNNALAPILMATELLHTITEDSGQKRLIEVIQVSAKRGADMVRQVLTFAKGANGERGYVQSKHLLREMKDLCRQTFPKTIEANLEMSADLWALVADPTQLHQVLLNLCVNARDAMPHGGLLTIGAENLRVDEGYAKMVSPKVKVGPYVVFRVTDTGIGMTPEVCARIFDPFFTTKAADKGTGLGLATVQKITSSHGGFFTVKSTPGVGTEFKVHLPAEIGFVSVSESAIAASPPRPMGKGELILVADDEAAIRSIAAQTLETFGYRVLTAIDGAHAIALSALHRDQLRLMITDMVMPVMDGMAAIRAVRSIVPHIRIIATSGMDGSEGKQPGGQPSIHAYLNKPYSADQLLQAVNDVLYVKISTVESVAGDSSAEPR